MHLKRKVKSMRIRIKEDEAKTKIKALKIAIEKLKKQHKALSEVLKAQYEKEVEESEEEVKAWKRQVENLTSLMVKEKKEYEDKVSILEIKIEELSTAHDEKIKCMELEIEGGKSKMEEVTVKKFFIFDQLKDKIECPVCLEIPRSGPIHVCPNGHIVCKKCKTGSCPTCRGAMGNGKSLLAVTLIENIEHMCKFVDCEELFAVDKLDDHEKICKHREVNCPFDPCSEKVPLSKLLDHLGQQTCSYDSVPKVIGNSSKRGRVNFRTESEDMSRSDLNWNVNTFSYQNSNFAVFPIKCDNFYYFVMVMFESESECSKFKIKMEVHERDSSSSNDSEVSFRFSGKPISIDEDKTEVKYFGLTVNSNAMEKIIRKSSVNSFSVSFMISNK